MLKLENQLNKYDKKIELKCQLNLYCNKNSWVYNIISLKVDNFIYF